MMSNEPIGEMELVTAVFKWLSGVLPEPWVIEPPVWGAPAPEMARRSGTADTILERPTQRWVPDATVLLRAGHARVRYVIEVKRDFEPRQVSRLPDLSRWKRSGASTGADTELGGARGAILVAPYLSPRARLLLMQANWSYADLANNARLVSERPPLFVLIAGSNRAPRGTPRPVRTLSGTAAGRLVRTLTDFGPPLKFQDIATRSKVSPAQVSRLVRLLERDALVERAGRGTVRRVDWAALVQRWSEDYSFLNANRVLRYMALRGRPSLLDQLRKTSLRYAITGGVAAETMKTSAPTRVTAIYADRVDELARELELEPVPDNPTVLLAEPWDPVIFERTFERDGLRYAAPAQVVADLLTSGDRYPMMATSVLTWMKEHEREWRR